MIWAVSECIDVENRDKCLRKSWPTTISIDSQNQMECRWKKRKHFYKILRTVSK